MAVYANSTYSISQQMAVLKAEQRTVRFEYEIIDGSTGISKGLFYDILPGGSVEYGYLNEIKRTGKFTVVENVNDSLSRINFLLDMVQIYCVFDFFDQLKGNQSLRFPIGRFVLSSNSRSVSGGLASRDVEAYDQCKILKDDTLTTRYELAAGAVVTTAIVSILAGAGIKSINIDPSAGTMKAARSWEPGTSKLVVINELLDLIGRGSLFFDGIGTARSRQYVAPAARTVDISYQTDSESVLTPEISQEIDLSSVPNQWTYVISQPDVPVVSATYQNTNIDSPTSIPSRGRIVAFFSTENEDATSLGELMAKAMKKAAEDSQVYETVNINTLIMPIHDENETIYLYHDDAMTQGYNYSEMSWSIPLNSDGTGTMSHSLRRVVSVTAS